MVKLFSREHTFSHPFSLVSSAFWRKYPNEHSQHVKHIDLYDRRFVTLPRHEDNNTPHSLHATDNIGSPSTTPTVPSSSSTPISTSISPSPFISPPLSGPDLPLSALPQATLDSLTRKLSPFTSITSLLSPSLFSTAATSFPCLSSSSSSSSSSTTSSSSSSSSCSLFTPSDVRDINHILDSQPSPSGLPSSRSHFSSPNTPPFPSSSLSNLPPLCESSHSSSSSSSSSTVPSSPATDTCLLTNRLIRCESSLPSWLTSLGVSTTAYIVECTVINPRTQEMVVKSRNLTGSKLIQLEETCRYTASPISPLTHTTYTQTAHISATLPLFSSKAEQLTLSNFQAKSQAGLATIETICQRLKAELASFGNKQGGEEHESTASGSGLLLSIGETGTLATPPGNL